MALGEPAQASALSVGISEPFLALSNVPVTVTDTSSGATSMLVTAVTTFLADVANDFATMAAAFNDYVIAPYNDPLTDSTGGAAATALAANTEPSPAAGAATTSAPKAGFDTQLATIANAVASMAKVVNELAFEAGLPAQLTDNSTGTASATLSLISASLTAVNGSTGAVAVDEVTALQEMTNVSNNLSSIGAAINTLAAVYNVPPLGTDALAGTVSNILVAISATAAGVGGTGNVTLLNSAVDTWLGITANNISTLAAVINAMVAIVHTTKPLLVIAG